MSVKVSFHTHKRNALICTVDLSAFTPSNFDVDRPRSARVWAIDHCRRSRIHRWACRSRPVTRLLHCLLIHKPSCARSVTFLIPPPLLSHPHHAPPHLIPLTSSWPLPLAPRPACALTSRPLRVATISRAIKSTPLLSLIIALPPKLSLRYHHLYSLRPISSLS